MVAEASSSVESYKHKYAKMALISWLKEAAQQAGYDRYARLWDLGWKVNRKPPEFGIHEEYPIARSVLNGRDVYAWDETKWLRTPTYQELIDSNDAPKAILDVAIQEKGAIAYAFEVVHTHGIDPNKAMLLNQLNFPTYEVDAEWVLRQVKCPSALRYRAAYWRGWQHG